MTDLLVVGSGFFGLTVADRCARGGIVCARGFDAGLLDDGEEAVGKGLQGFRHFLLRGNRGYVDQSA